MSHLSWSNNGLSSETSSRSSSRTRTVSSSRVNWDLHDDYHLIDTILQNRRQLLLTIPARGFWELISHKFSMIVHFRKRNPRQCRDRFHILFHKSKVLFQVENDTAGTLIKAYQNKNKFDPHTDEAKAKVELDLNLLLLQVHKVLHFNKGLKLLDLSPEIAPLITSKKSPPRIEKIYKKPSKRKSRKERKKISLKQLIKQFAPLGIILAKFCEDNDSDNEVKKFKKMLTSAFEKIALALQTLCKGIKQLHEKAQSLRLLIDTLSARQKQWSGMMECLESYWKGGDTSHFADLLRWSDRLQSHIANGDPGSLQLESKFNGSPSRTIISRNTILSNDLVLFEDY